MTSPMHSSVPDQQAGTALDVTDGRHEHGDVTISIEVVDLEMATANPASASARGTDRLALGASDRAWALHVLRCHQWIECADAEAAAFRLASPKSSSVARASAVRTIAAFNDQKLKLDTEAVRRSFEWKWRSRIDRFELWTALIDELRSGRWRRTKFPFRYLHIALAKSERRYYIFEKENLRRADQLDSAARAKVRFADDDAEPGLEGNDQVVSMVQCPDAGVVRLDLLKLLSRIDGLPDDVAILLASRFAQSAPDAEIAIVLGWTTRRLENAQAALNRTWRPRIEEAFAAGGYAPPPRRQWCGKHQIIRRTVGKKAEKSPFTQQETKA